MSFFGGQVVDLRWFKDRRLNHRRSTNKHVLPSSQMFVPGVVGMWQVTYTGGEEAMMVCTNMQTRRTGCSFQRKRCVSLLAAPFLLLWCQKYCTTEVAQIDKIIWCTCLAVYTWNLTHREFGIQKDRTFHLECSFPLSPSLRVCHKIRWYCNPMD